MALTSFADNPIVGALSNALGMGALLNPAPKEAAQIQPPPVGANETERVRESRQVRQSYPKASARGLRPGGASQAQMSMLPGMMSPEVLLHPETQKLLGQYGITPQNLLDTANAANGNLFVQNPAAFEKHPVLAGMLERGLEGAAFTQPSQTIGEGISNVARGMMDAQSARIAKFNNQLMVPFGEAQTSANLRAMAQEEALRASQEKYQEAHANYFDQYANTMPFIKALQAENQHERIVQAGLGQQLKVATDPAFSHLTPDDKINGKSFQDYIAGLGGDWSQADPGVINQFQQLGQAHLDKLTQGNKKEIANIQGGYRVAAAGAGASARTTQAGNNAHITDLKTTWTSAKNDVLNAQREQAAFNKEVSNMNNLMIQNPFYGRADYPGQPQFLRRNSPELQKVQAELGRLVKQNMANEDAAKKAYDAGVGSAPTTQTTTVSVHGPSAHIPTYNVITGKIE